MPLMIRRDNTKFTFRKRYFILSFSIIAFSIMVYRACFIAYYFNAIRLGKFKIEKINLVQDKGDYELAFSNTDAKPFSVEVKMNFSKCMCPLFLEIMDIKASLFLNKSTDSTKSLLQIAVSDIKLEKKKPFEFRAKAKFKNINFSTPVLDLLSIDFIVEFSFIIRARFCYIPLCFSKVISRKKSDIIKKSGNTLNLNFLSTRLHRLDDVPCLQIGIKKKFFSTLNSESPFTFDVGCIKTSFEGFLNFFLLITSFSTDKYTEFGDDPLTANTFEELTSIIPGEHIIRGKGPDDSVVFYFIHIPISNFANLVQATIRISDNTRKFLRIKMVSALLLPPGNTEKYTSFLSESLKRSEGVCFDIEEQKAFNVIRIINKVSSPEAIGLYRWKVMPEFVDTWSLYKLVLMKATSDKIQSNLNFNMSLYEWKNRKNGVSFKMGLYSDHPLWVLLSSLFHADELINNSIFKTSFSFEVALYNVPYINISFSLVKSQPGDKFQNIFTVNLKVVKKLLLRLEDICHLQIRPKSFKFGKYIVVVENIIALSADYPKSINLIDPCGASFPIYHFKKDQEHSIIANHIVRNYPASNFLKIDTSVDTSTYGFHNVSQNRNKSIFSASFSIIVEVPKFPFSITNSFLKVKATTIPTFLSYSFSSQSPEPCFKGVFNLTSAFAFQKSWDPSKLFMDALCEEKMVLSTLTELFAFTFSINDFKGPKNASNPDFLKILPFEIKFDPDFPYKGNNPSKLHIKHILQQNQETFEAYKNCKDPKIYKKHNLLNNFPTSSEKPASSLLFIRNLVTTSSAEFAGIVNGVPIVLIKTTNPTVVVTLTHTNLFVYMKEIIKLDISPVYLDEIKAFRKDPRVWIQNRPMHSFIQFIIDVLIYDPLNSSESNPLLTKPRRGKIGMSMKILPIKADCISANIKLVIPAYVIHKLSFVNIDLFCTSEFQAVQDKLDVFSLLFDVGYADKNYVIEISAKISTSFVKTPTNVCAKFNNTYFGQCSTSLLQLSNLFLPIFSLIKNSDRIHELNSVDYSSPAFISAFGVEVNDYRGTLFSFDPKHVFHETPFFSISRKDCMPPAINLSIKDIEGFQEKLKVNMQLGVDAVTDFLGNIIFDIVFFLPVTVLPEAFDAHIDIPEAFSLKVDLSNKPVFSIKIREVQSTLSIPIKKLKCKVTEEERADPTSLFESYRDKINKKTEIDKNFINCSVELNSDNISHIVTNLIKEKFQVSFLLSEPFETLCANFNNKDGDSNCPRFMLRYGSLPLLSIDFKMPFIINFVGDPLYIFTYRKGFVKLSFMTKGCFMDPLTAAEGYYLTIPSTLNLSLSYKQDPSISTKGCLISNFRDHGVVSPHQSTYEDIFIIHKNKVLCYPVFLINPNSVSFRWLFTLLLDTPLRVFFFGATQQSLPRNISIVLKMSKMLFGSNIRVFIDTHVNDRAQVHFGFYKDFVEMPNEMEEVIKKSIALAYTT
ncbi:hypothetical protein GINT2_000327 [Glugoides intestinalis]